MLQEFVFNLQTIQYSINEVPYLSQINFEEYFVIIFGEIFGTLILTAGFLIQYDQNTAQSGLYGVDRTLSYVAKNSLNLAITIGLVFFECCKDGYWARYLNLWIYAGLPFIQAFISFAFIRIQDKKRLL